MVVDPLRRIAVLVQPRNMRAYPSTRVSERIGAAGNSIRVVMVDRRCPINRYATQDETQKNGHVEPVAAPHQQVVPADYKHAGV